MCVMSRMSRSSRRLRMYCSSIVLGRLLLDERLEARIVERVGDREDVFVASPGLVDDHDVVGRKRTDLAESARERVRGLERGYQPFLADGQRQRLHDLGV